MNENAINLSHAESETHATSRSALRGSFGKFCSSMRQLVTDPEQFGKDLDVKMAQRRWAVSDAGTQADGSLRVLLRGTSFGNEGSELVCIGTPGKEQGEIRWNVDHSHGAWAGTEISAMLDRVVEDRGLQKL